MTLTQITISRHDGTPFDITAELVTEHFAITPAIGKDQRFRGFLTLTHIPTGKTLMPYWVIKDLTVEDLRSVAEIAEKSTVDWDDFQHGTPAAQAFLLAFNEYHRTAVMEVSA